MIESVCLSVCLSAELKQKTGSILQNLVEGGARAKDEPVKGADPR